jgi:hypothetical protein
VYSVVDDITTDYWAGITGVVTDEIFGTLKAPEFAVNLDRTDLSTKAVASGMYALSGYPMQSFPQLASTSYVVNYLLSAPGYRDFPMTVTVPVNATFPVNAFAAALRLLPVQIQGRVVSSTTRLPVDGAVIVSLDPASPPAMHYTVLRAPLCFAHASGAAAQEVSTATTGSAALTQDVIGGDQILNLSIRTGLAAGSIVRLANASGVRLEYGVVDHLGPGAAISPGKVFLRNALNYTYPMAVTTVTFVSVTPVGGAATLSADADAGDGILLGTQLFSQTVALEAGTPQAEVHEVGALTGADGYYALDGMGRVKQIILQASKGALQQAVDWFLEYDRPFNVVDFRL